MRKRSREPTTEEAEEQEEEEEDEEGPGDTPLPGHCPPGQGRCQRGGRCGRGVRVPSSALLQERRECRGAAGRAPRAGAAHGVGAGGAPLRPSWIWGDHRGGAGEGAPVRSRLWGPPAPGTGGVSALGPHGGSCRALGGRGGVPGPGRSPGGAGRGRGGCPGAGSWSGTRTRPPARPGATPGSHPGPQGSHPGSLWSRARWAVGRGRTHGENRGKKEKKTTER